MYESKLRGRYQMIKFSFKTTIPVMLGYLFLGSAFGILLQQAGYSWPWALLMSAVIYAGSGQFLLVGLLASGAPLSAVAVLTLLINSRHIFYGLSFLDKFRDMGARFPYMAFSLTDETYSLLSSIKFPEGIDSKRASFYIALFNHSYWIIGSLLGSIIGPIIPAGLVGVEFSMTALFVVLFVEHWKNSSSHIPSIIGLASGILSIIIFGSENFILQSLVVTSIILVLAEPFIAKREKVKAND